MATSDFAYDVKERVKQAVDIVDLIGSYIQLRRQGRNYVGLCPWHDDSRPSLQVNPERQSFKCWVCDIGGDVFSFIMKMEGVEFREALEILAERAGIAIERPQPHQHFSPSSPQPSPEESTIIETPDGQIYDLGQPADAPAAPQQNKPQKPSNAAIKRTLLQAMAWAEKQYHHCLLTSPEADVARRYLKERGITDESIERFCLGFSPLDRGWILQQASRQGDRAKLAHRTKVLERIGILIRPEQGGSAFDRFRGRVLFAIHDAQGRPVGVGGRVLPELGSKSPAKYVNSPETPLFTKSKLLYGLDLARETMRKTRTAIVMEGYTDVIVAHQFGFTNAVAVLGTALGESHVRLLKAHVDRIVLVLDGDEAGTKRANEVLELFIAQQADLQILTLPEDLDPCDYLHKYGADAFRDLLEHKAVDALDHAFEVTTHGIDVDRDVHGVGQAIERLLGLVAKAPRLSSATRADDRIQEQKILQRLAARFRVDEIELRRRLATLRRNAAKKATTPHLRQARQDQASSEENNRPSEPVSPWESAVLQLVIAHPEFFSDIQERISPERFKNSQFRRIFEAAASSHAEGTPPSFDRLMLVFEEPALQSILVAVDEKAAATQQAKADPATLLKGLCETLQRDELERQRPGQIGALREGELDVAQQAALLDAILQQRRAKP